MTNSTMTGLGPQPTTLDPSHSPSDLVLDPVPRPVELATAPMMRLIWLALAALGLIDAAWLVAGNFRLPPSGLVAPAASTLALIGAAWIMRLRRRNPAIITLLDGIAQILACFALGGIFSYLTISANQPFVDRELAMLDRLMGFDWPGYVGWVRAHTVLDTALYIAYHCTALELIVVALLLGALRPERMTELSATIFVGLMLTLVIAGIFPAAGPYLYHAATHPQLVAEVPMTHHLALRDGTLREIDLRHLQGLVSFPSFHVILSLLFIYAMRGIRFAVPVGILVNAPIIAGTLSAGGHYLIDLPGGAAVTLVAIALYHLAAHWLATPPAAAVAAPDLAEAAAD
jgi:hypothetical protein